MEGGGGGNGFFFLYFLNEMGSRCRFCIVINLSVIGDFRGEGLSFCFFD